MWYKQYYLQRIFRPTHRRSFARERRNAWKLTVIVLEYTEKGKNDERTSLKLVTCDRDEDRCRGTRGHLHVNTWVSIPGVKQVRWLIEAK